MPGFNPTCACEVKTWFQAFALKFNLYLLQQAVRMNQMVNRGSTAAAEQLEMLGGALHVESS
jgi:hypothetical protein